MARVVITAHARRDLRNVRRHIEQDSPALAARMVAMVIAATRQLETFPASGRVVPEMANPEIREVFVRRYRVIYRFRANNVRITMVLHSARLLDVEELRSRL